MQTEMVPYLMMNWEQRYRRRPIVGWAAPVDLAWVHRRTLIFRDKSLGSDHPGHHGFQTHGALKL